MWNLKESTQRYREHMRGVGDNGQKGQTSSNKSWGCNVQHLKVLIRRKKIVTVWVMDGFLLQYTIKKTFKNNIFESKIIFISLFYYYDFHSQFFPSQSFSLLNNEINFAL